MTNNIGTICDKEISRLSKNVRFIKNKSNITNNDIDELNRLYDDLDFYNYHKNYKRLQKMLLEDYECE